jgi:hypothetical protein
MKSATSSFVLWKRLSLLNRTHILALHSRFIGCLPLAKSIINQLINALSLMIKPIFPLILG